MAVLGDFRLVSASLAQSEVHQTPERVRKGYGKSRGPPETSKWVRKGGKGYGKEGKGTERGGKGYGKQPSDQPRFCPQDSHVAHSVIITCESRRMFGDKKWMISERFKNEIEQLCAIKRTSLGENMKKKRRVMGLARSQKAKPHARTAAER